MAPEPESAVPPDGPVRVLVSGDLDLHTYRPRDLPDLLPSWFEECRARGILTVRVIHGKGSGSLRMGVHALLPRLAGHVASWTHPAAGAAGGWGATLVRLNP
jgi:DNA-nicking Smr family endonuclease